MPKIKKRNDSIFKSIDEFDLKKETTHAKETMIEIDNGTTACIRHSMLMLSNSTHQVRDKCPSCRQYTTVDMKKKYMTCENPKCTKFNKPIISIVKPRKRKKTEVASMPKLDTIGSIMELNILINRIRNKSHFIYQRYEKIRHLASMKRILNQALTGLEVVLNEVDNV